MFLDVRSSIVCSRVDALAIALHVDGSPAFRRRIDRVAAIPIKYSKAGIILHGFIVMWRILIANATAVNLFEILLVEFVRG
jgi:hypothetical protein